MTNTRRKQHKMFIGTVLAVILFFITLILSVNIREVSVNGNKHYTKDQLVELLFRDRWDYNSAYCYIKNHFMEKEEIPFIEDYQIEFQGLDQVEVIVHEKSLVGYVYYMDSYMYFDKDGIIVESSSDKLDGIPWITGLKFGHIVLHKELPVENQQIFNDILNLTQILSTFEIAVDEINFNSMGQATLTLGEITVALGDNTSMEGKIAALNDQLPHLQGRSGTLLLDNYDETNHKWSSFIEK